ncbi:relaxase/mobilization nuclease domain-containing protein [Oscillospiraceae bacterium 50-60]
MEQIAIIHFTNYPKGQSRACMGAVMRYTQQEKKTLWEGRQLVSGVNCRPESVCDDFLRTKLLYHKEGGTMFYHMVQSFPADEKVDPTVAHAAALKLAEWFQGREVLVCTHVDRDHVHSHFLVNSVSFEEGKKLHISEPELAQLRQRNDQVCMEFGLPVFQPQKRRKVKSMSGAEYHTAARGESWKFRLMNTIDECMRYARNQEEFIALMRSEGYDVRWTDSRKSITYTTPGGMRCRDDRLHDEKYLKERMEVEFRIRQAVIHGGTAPAEYAEACHGDTASHGGGVVRADRRTDDVGRTLGRADDPAAGADCLTQAMGDAGTAGGVDPGGESDMLSGQTGWEAERAALFSANDPTAPALAGVAVDSGGAVGAVGAVVRLGRALEQSDNPVPISDATTVHRHTDSKTLRREREKKIALGHREDDHEDTQNWQQTM